MKNNKTWQVKDFIELSTDELYKILELRIDVFVVEQNCPYREIDGKDLAAKHLFLIEQNRIIAYMRILPRSISFPEISFGRVVVAREYRGKGIASQLLEEAIKFIKTEWNETEVRIRMRENCTKPQDSDRHRKNLFSMEFRIYKCCENELFPELVIQTSEICRNRKCFT